MENEILLKSGRLHMRLFTQKVVTETNHIPIICARCWGVIKGVSDLTELGSNGEEIMIDQITADKYYNL